MPKIRWRDSALLYRATCPRCRTLSLLAVFLSLGRLRRVALGSVEAESLCEARPEACGRLSVAVAGELYTGGRFAVGLLRATAALRPCRRAPLTQRDVIASPGPP